MNDLVYLWSNPPAEFRGAPFWAWNGALEEEELRRQVRAFKTMGLGGFFMHSRIGLDTEYLSEEWFHCINACIDEAKKLGMFAGLYDEDRYPSGSAGGLVVREHPEFRARRIFHLEAAFDALDGLDLPENIVRIFAIRKNAGNFIDSCRMVADLSMITSGEYAVIFSEGECQHSSWFNDLCYVDVLNPQAVEKFIELTHEEYFRRFGEFFGNVVRSIFSDEPHYGFVANKLDWENETVYSTPWNDAIRSRIQERYGYDIYDRLPEIFYRQAGSDFSSAAYHYIKVMTEIFLEAFARPIGEWCEKHNILFTGHVMGEDTLAMQAWNCGSVMRFYEYMGMPGCDQLREGLRGYSVAKMVSSAAHQFGKKWRLSEMYGCTGWDFPLKGHKALGDWQAALGINFRCQHIAHYTLKGEAKRDFPASISYQSTWHDHYRDLEDYFARINLFLTGSEEQCDILLMTPVESTWGIIRMDLLESPEIARMESEFQKTQDVLWENLLDFEFGDEEILERHGKLDGKGRLQIGQAAYRAVVIPEMKTIRRSTLNLLRRWMEQGGMLVCCGKLPDHIDGESRKADEWLLDGAACCLVEELPEFLASLRRVDFTSEQTGVRANSLLFRETCDGLFLVNTGHRLSENITGELPYRSPDVSERQQSLADMTLSWKVADGFFYVFDPVHGSITSAGGDQQGEWRRFDVSLAPLESLLLLRFEAPLESKTEWTSMQNDTFSYRIDRPNVLVLDHIACRFDDEKEFGEREFIPALDDRIRRRMDIPDRNNMMVQPWYRKKFLESNRMEKSCDVALLIRVDVEYLPESDLFLALEAPEKFTIKINGMAVENRICGFWLDRAIGKVRLDVRLFQLGENQIELSCCYHEEDGLEALYLLGDFGVRLDGIDGVVTRLPEQLQLGDIGTQGFPFFEGYLTYEWQRRGTMIKIGRFEGALAQAGGRRIWNAPEVVENYGGESTCTVCITPRNAMGPFFYPEKRPAWCGPEQFKAHTTSFRQLVPGGLYELEIGEKIYSF